MFLQCPADEVFSQAFDIKAVSAPFGHVGITLLALLAAQKGLPSTALAFCMDLL